MKIVLILLAFACAELISFNVFANKVMSISSAVFPPFTTDAIDGFEDRVIPKLDMALREIRQ